MLIYIDICLYLYISICIYVCIYKYLHIPSIYANISLFATRMR